MKLFLRLFTFVFAALFLTACPQTSNEDDLGKIPSVHVSCHTRLCEAQTSGYTAYVGIVSNRSEQRGVRSKDCPTILSNQTVGQQFHELFEASGSTPVSSIVNNAGAFLAGSVSSWYNFAKIQVYDLATDETYRVCAFIDINRDSYWQSTEPIGYGDLSAGSETYELQNWLN